MKGLMSASDALMWSARVSLARSARAGFGQLPAPQPEVFARR